MDQGLVMLIMFILAAVCVVALFVVLSLLFHDLVEETRRKAEESPGRAFLVGLINFLFVVAISIGLNTLGQNLGLEFIGYIIVILIFLLAVGLVFGVSGMVDFISRKLTPEQTGWRRTAGGAIATTLACLAPYVGWYGLLPYIGLRGLGAFILSLVARAPSSELVEPADAT